LMLREPMSIPAVIIVSFSYSFAAIGLRAAKPKLRVAA